MKNNWEQYGSTYIIIIFFLILIYWFVKTPVIPYQEPYDITILNKEFVTGDTLYYIPCAIAIDTKIVKGLKKIKKYAY